MSTGSFKRKSASNKAPLPRSSLCARAAELGREPAPEIKTMNTFWLIAKIAIYTTILNVLYRQTYNFIFVLARRPVAWILTIAALGAANMVLAYALAWDPRLVITATLITVFINLSPSTPKGVSKEEFRASIDATYEERGIARGRLMSRLGFISFVICSLCAYALLFGELCTISGECTTIIESIYS